MSNLTNLKQDLKKLSDPIKAAFFPKFFKTGKGQYGEGDLFLGVTVPNMRVVAKDYPTLTLSEIGDLLHSKYHEERLVALFILVNKFPKSLEAEKTKIYDFYLKNTKFVNNWDLVDSSADKIVGHYLFGKDRSILYKLAGSTLLWDRRIAIVATYYFIRKNQFEDTLKIAKLLLDDKEDLMHKAVGWMLREVGKRSQQTLINFLNENTKQMPRTALRYSIEHFPQEVRLEYLKK